MANNCYNYLKIEGTEEDIKRLEECIKSKDKYNNDTWDISKIIPVETDERGCYKVDDIYELWGTKWFQGVCFQNNGDSATLSFETAWSPSLPVTLEMSRRFNLKINHEYEEAGCDFEGDYNVNCGEVIFEEEREYRPNCQDCGEKFEQKDIIYNEDDCTHKCKRCEDGLTALMMDKMDKIKAERGE